GGLVCEPMARLGANVTGIDADANAISVAAAHAGQSGLSIDYRAVSSEELLKSKAKFDVVLALEIVEHVSDVGAFVQNCADLCKPGGIVIFSTLNRTAKSFVLGKMAAEYILGWVPKGTHDWKKFLKPSELARAGRSAGIHPYDTEGMIFDAAAGNFKRSRRDIDVNYFMAFSKQA
ncbi:MAG: 3-demethylubiquinone-9 3-O-methyltransferase, partial [Micavibrio aeruginosavorus]